MRTSIIIDKKLIKEAMSLSNIHTKKEVVEESLKLFVRMRKQAYIRKLRGKLNWQGNLNKMRDD